MLYLPFFVGFFCCFFFTLSIAKQNLLKIKKTIHINRWVVHNGVKLVQVRSKLLVYGKELFQDNNQYALKISFILKL